MNSHLVPRLICTLCRLIRIQLLSLKSIICYILTQTKKKKNLYRFELIWSEFWSKSRFRLCFRRMDTEERKERITMRGRPSSQIGPVRRFYLLQKRKTGEEVEVKEHCLKGRKVSYGVNFWNYWVWNQYICYILTQNQKKSLQYRFELIWSRFWSKSRFKLRAAKDLGDPSV